MTWNQFVMRVLATTGIVVAVTALFVISWYAVDILFLLFGSFLFALLVRAISDGLANRTGLNPKLSVAIVLLSIGAAISFAAWLLAPNALNQLQDLSNRLPALRKQLEQSGFGNFVAHFPGIRRVVYGNGTLMSRFKASMTGWSVTPLYTALAALVGVFLSIHPHMYRDGLIRLFPLPVRPRAAEVIDVSTDALRWWLVAKTIGMVFVGLFVGVGLWILGVPLAFPLGVIAGLLDFIPNIGAILSVIPAALLAALRQPDAVVGVLLVYIAAHSIDNYVLLPWLQLRLVKVPPALALAAQLVLGVLIGPLGLIFAVPLLALLLVLGKQIYLRDALGDPEVGKEF